MARPLIGIPGRRKLGNQIVDFPATMASRTLDLYFADYASAIYAAGGLPLHLPFGINCEDVVEAMDGLLLPGGADIEPRRYGDKPITNDFPPESIRDEFELELLRGAAELELPVLGICRGLQLIDVYAGGTLHQEVPTHMHLDKLPETEIHLVEFAPGSALEEIYGSKRSVNSLHHQTVATIGDELMVTARAGDGTIEGLEHLSLPWMAVQWHPEMMTNPHTDPLFGWLVEKAGAP